MAVAQPYPQSNPPFFRQRKSATIIPISSSSSSGSEGSKTPTTSPSKTNSILPDRPLSPPTNEYSDLIYSAMSSPLPSFHSIDPHGIPERVRDSLDRRDSMDSSSAAEEGEVTPLLGEQNGLKGQDKWYQGPLFITGVRLSVLFVIFTAVVAGTFWFGMPTLDEEDRGILKIPKSFADLQALNSMFQKYRIRFPYRILTCGVVSYLFVQAFTLPGSMYISIIFGAAYGMVYGLFLSCVCEAAGATLCYLLSAILAPPLLALPFYRARVETWRVKIMGDPKKGKQVSWDGVLAFLIVLRIAPFPPHWVANFVAPHLDISPLLFFSSVFIGIAPVSVIHVTIGSSLDSMTSAADFHILSVRNVLGLCAVGVAVLIPTGLKRVFRKDLGDLGEAEAVFEGESIDTREVEVPAIDNGEPRRYQAIDSGVVLAGPSTGDPNLDIGGKVNKGKGRAVEIIADIRDDDEGHYTVYDVEQPHVAAEKVRPQKAYVPIQEYGAIETVGREPAEVGKWWPISRS